MQNFQNDSLHSFPIILVGSLTMIMTSLMFFSYLFASVPGGM